MRGGVGRLVQVDAAILLQDVNWTVCRGIAARKRGEVRRLHVQLVEVLKTWSKFTKVKKKQPSADSSRFWRCLQQDLSIKDVSG